MRIRVRLPIIKNKTKTLFMNSRFGFWNVDVISDIFTIFESIKNVYSSQLDRAKS